MTIKQVIDKAVRMVEGRYEKPTVNQLSTKEVIDCLGPASALSSGLGGGRGSGLEPKVNKH